MSLFVFGDSFVQPFEILNFYEKYIVRSYKGKTMKGLTKNNSEISKEILENIKDKISKDTKCIIFSFGYVDVINSYYYTKYIKKQDYNIREIIRKYVNFVKNIELPNQNIKKIIINFFYTSLHNEINIIYNILKSCKININDFEKLSDKEIKNNFSLEFIKKKYMNNSKYLSDQCDLNNIKYISLNNDILNENHKVKNEYLPKNIPFNIHYRWDTFFVLFIKRMNDCGCDIKIKDENKNEVKKHYKLYKETPHVETLKNPNNNIIIRIKKRLENITTFH